MSRGVTVAMMRGSCFMSHFHLYLWVVIVRCICYWHCPHAMRSRVYGSVGRPCVCPSLGPQQQTRCCKLLLSARPAIHRLLQQRRTAENACCQRICRKLNKDLSTSDVLMHENYKEYATAKYPPRNAWVLPYIYILLCGLEACPLLKSDLSSLDFVVNRPFMKLFKTSNIDVVKCYQDHSGFDLPSVSWSKRVKKFEAKFHACNNLLCNMLWVCRERIANCLLYTSPSPRD